MMVHAIQVPYDSGHRNVRMGQGPARLMGAGLARELEAAGHQVRVEAVETSSPFAGEAGSTFELARSVAERVAAAREAGAFPLVLAGNCASALGTVAGLGTGGTGVVWLDAHGDFHTPDTTGSGFLDGMALAAVTGRCWRRLSGTIPGFVAIPEARVVHAGGRDFDPGERERAEGWGMAVVPATEIRARGVPSALVPALRTLRSRAQRLYLHIDLDVLDPKHGKANPFAAPGGLSPDDVLAVVDMVAACAPVQGAALTAYDPAQDPAGGVAEAALRIAAHIALRAQP